MDQQEHLIYASAKMKGVAVLVGFSDWVGQNLAERAHPARPTHCLATVHLRASFYPTTPHGTYR
jgi:hypothetical protein